MSIVVIVITFSFDGGGQYEQLIGDAELHDGPGKDRFAVESAVSRSGSNARTEGQITRVKLPERQVYGCAKFDILRRWVLYA